MSHGIAIVSSSARTPLGLGAAAAAALRSGVSRLGHHPFMIDQVGEPMPGALDPEIDAALFGAQRFLKLAETALREACAIFKPAYRIRVPLFVALPERRPGFADGDIEAIRNGLSMMEGLPVEISEVVTLARGHAAGFAALEKALASIEQCGVCIVGGIESYFHPDTMDWLDENRQLAGSVSRSAFVPGEGAGFFVLTQDEARAKWGWSTLGRVLGATSAIETKLIKTADVFLGKGLSQAIERVFAGVPKTSPVSDIICDINGERYRGEEWGFVCLQFPHAFSNPTAYIAPATGWGDMGAASGPLFVMLACQAAARGYATGDQSLLWGSSEQGLRGCALLSFADVAGKRRAHG